jgi:hypothetical protein
MLGSLFKLISFPFGVKFAKYFLINQHPGVLEDGLGLERFFY